LSIKSTHKTKQKEGERVPSIKQVLPAEALDLWTQMQKHGIPLARYTVFLKTIL
jgi:hypothetical protein